MNLQKIHNSPAFKIHIFYSFQRGILLKMPFFCQVKFLREKVSPKGSTHHWPPEDISVKECFLNKFLPSSLLLVPLTLFSLQVPASAPTSLLVSDICLRK